MPMKHQNLQLNDELLFLITCCQLDPSEDDIKFIFSYLNAEHFELNGLIRLANQHGILPLIYKTIKHLSHLELNSDTPVIKMKEGCSDNLNATHLTLNSILSELKPFYMSIVQRNMLMTSELIKIMLLLRENNIEVLAFKGPLLSQMAYGDITLRQYSDLDILIHPKDLFDAVKLLENDAYTALYPLSNKQFKGYSDIAHDYGLINQKNNTLVELHWRLLSNEFMADINTIDFFKNTTTVSIQGNKLKTLGLEELIIYLCIHGAKHQWERLEWLVDIDYLIKTQSVDWEKIISLTYQTSSEKMVLSAFSLCSKYLKTNLPHNLQKHLQKPNIKNLSKKLEIHFVKHFSDSLHRSVRTKTISFIQLQLLHGIKNKLLFLTSLIKPTQLDYLSYPLPSQLTFLYYFIRPYNIIKRWSGKIFNKKEV